MTVADLLEQLRELDIRLQVSAGKLLVDAPRDAMTEAVRIAIRKHRDELVQLLGDQRQKLPPLVRQSREQTATEFPLSISQHAFFMLDRLSPQSRAFNIFSVRELTGPLDVDRLAQAWSAVVNKHDALRTAIQWHNGNARQMVYSRVPVEIELIDLSGLTVEQTSGLSTRLSGRQAAPHFELERGSLFKLRLVREQVNRHVMVMSVHHIVADDRSVELLYQDLVQAYAAPVAAGTQSALPQYPDYAVWERRLLDAGGLDPSIDYWRRQLTDMPSLLPQRVSGQIVSEAVSATIYLELGNQLAQHLWQLAASTETSRFAVVLTAFQLLWALQTRQPDVPIIVPATSREIPESRNMVGLFVNAVVMRARLDEQGGIAGVIKANADMINASLSHRIISLEALDGILRLRGEADLNLENLSRIGFNYLVADTDQQALTLGDLTICARRVDRTESVFAILLVVQEVGSRLQIKLEYREDIWSATEAQQFADQFVHVLSAFCDPRNERLNQITAMPEQYLQQLTESQSIPAQAIRPLPRYWRQYFGLQQQLEIPSFSIQLPLAENADRQSALAQLKPAIAELNRQLPGYFNAGMDGADDLYMYSRPDTEITKAVSCGELEKGQSIATAVARAKRSIDVSNDQLATLLVADDCCVLVATALPGKTIWQHWLTGLLLACPAITTPALGIDKQTAQQLAPQLHYSRLSVTGQQLLDIEDYCRQQQLEPVRLVVAVTALLMTRFSASGQEIISWPMATDDTITKLTGGPQYYRPAQHQQGLSDWLRQAEPLVFNGFDKAHRQPQDFAWLLISGLSDEAEGSLLQTQHGHWLIAEQQVHLSLKHSADSLELECSLPVAWRDHCFVLERICAAMAQLVAGELKATELEYFSAQDAALLTGLNASANQTVKTDLTVMELFDRQLQDRHQHPALLFADQVMDYAELDAISNSYAQWLQQQISDQPQVLAVCLQRTPAMLAMLLGIWRAGCAWVPIDVTLPATRMNYMLAAAGATGLVVSAELQVAIPEASIPLLVMPEPAQLLPVVELPMPDADSLAYIMFTSGSTGHPKGVRITHAMLSNLLQSMAEVPGIQQHECMLAITSLSFDIALLELFMPLIAGATVYLSDSSPATDPAQIIKRLNSGVVDLCQATPSSWRLLLRCGWQGNPKLRIICGGEPLDDSLAESLLTGTAELWNAYGPTETTIWSTLSRVSAANCASHIGEPVANTCIRVVHQSGRLAAVGEVGELVIGGAGVALGYCGDMPDQQAVFFSDEQAGKKQRFYRTGDRVKVNRDGRLVFVGRTDRQIKLRGVRIELNEIESTLNAMPGVSESAVWLHARGSDSSCIAAAVAAENTMTADQLKAQLRAQLPAIMLPERLVVTQQLPRLVSGKLDRAKLLETAATRQMPAADTDQLETKLVNIWSELLGHDNFALTDNFFDIGGHSMLLIAAHQRIVNELEVELEPVELFTHTSIAALVQFLRSTGISDDNSNRQQLTTGQKSAVTADEPIAIIGIAGRFPQAADVSQFWQNLCAGREAIQELDEASLLEQGVPAQLLGDKSYVSKASLIDNVEDFDADFFGLSAREAELIDPQQRVLLELAYQALEDAGYDYRKMLADVGLFAGVGISSYLIYNLWPNRNEILNSISPLELLYANDKDYAATRISYLLNLRGPSLSVGTACSTGLVAVHQACTSLRQGECEMALAGAVKIAVPQNTGYIFREGGIMSPDGHCRPFDQNAAGTVFGSGGCCVLLKPLSAAERDGDPIHAVIRGSAINNDGHDKLGFTAPSVTGQANVIAAALNQAGVAPQQLGYVEAHGTGTRLGDPVEVAALQQVFAAGPEPDAACSLGSVKSNLGHLDTAAGITGLAKVVLSLQHGQLPPTINFTGLNEQIKLDPARFRIQTELDYWPAVPGKRYAGVSSFGIGGTNAHVVLQDYLPAIPASAATETDKAAQLVVLSGDTETALRQRQQALAEHLSIHSDMDLADLVYTLQSGRAAMRYRSVLVAASVAELQQQLQQQLQLAHSQPIVPAAHSSIGRVVFLFPGQGLELASYSAELYQRWPVYRQAFDHCAELVAGHSGLDLRELMLNKSGESGTQLRSTMVLQPALFAAQYSLAQLLMAIGIQPTALLGHSLGEITAACIAGVFSLEQAVRLVVARGELMQAAPEGAMLAVFASAQEVTAELGPEAQIAANNGNRITVISGSREELEATRAALASQAIDSRFLPTDRAFHSSHMDQASAGIKQLLAACKLQSPMIPMLSNLDGQWADAAIADGEYWARQACQPVRFIQCLQTLELTDSDVVIELDLNAGLTRLVMANNPELAPLLVTASPEFKPEVAADRRLLALLGFAWQRGCGLDWNAINPQHGRKKLHLPVYAFTRQRYWIQRPQAGAHQQQVLTRRNPAAQWLYQPTWVPRPGLAVLAEKQILTGHWVVFVSEQETAVELAAVKYLLATGCRLVIFKTSSAMDAELKPLTLVLEGADPEQLRLICAGLAEGFTGSCNILYGWSLQLQSVEAVAQVLCRLAKVAAAFDSIPLKLCVITANSQPPSGPVDSTPVQSVFSGALQVLQREHAELECRLLDVDTTFLNNVQQGQQLVQECLLAGDELCVARHNDQRWARAFCRYPASPLPEVPDTGAVYVITGGLGGIGALLAEHLITSRGCKVALIGRTPLNQQSEDSLEAVVSDKRSKRYQHLNELQPGLLYYAVDVADVAAVQQSLAAIRQQLGVPQAIIHAAGRADGQLAELHSSTSIADVLKPKLQGSLNIMQAAAAHGIGRVVLFSSISAVTGEVGQYAYAAANAFQDALAEQRNLYPGVDCFSINWDTWRDVGMAAESAVDGVAGTALMGMRERGLANPEGLELFDLLVSNAIQRVVVSTVDLDARIQADMQISAVTASAATGTTSYPRPALDNLLVEPQGELETSLSQLWAQALRLQQVGVCDNYFELGGTSLQALQVVAAIDSELNLRVAASALLERPTIRELAAYLEDRQHWDRQPEADQLLVALSHSEVANSEPLYLMHPIGGQVYLYRELAGLLSDTVNTYGIRAAGIETLDSAAATVESLASDYLAQIKSARGTTPTLLGGSSFGGMIAYAMAQQLAAAGKPPALLLMLDTPDAGEIAGRFSSDMQLLHYLADQMPEFGWLKMLLGQSDPRAVQAMLKTHNAGGGGGTNLYTHLGVLKQHMQSMQAYSAPPYAFPVVYIKAAQRRAGIDPLSPELAWQQRIAQFTLEQVNGDHISMHLAPHVAEVAAVIKDAISTLSPARRIRSAGS